MWTTPQPSFARLPGLEPRSSSSSPSITRPSGSRPPSTDLIKSKSKKKGKGKESPDSSGSSQRHPRTTHHTHVGDQQHRNESNKSPPLPHEEDAGPSGFGTANEDYNTLTKEYLEAAEHTGYNGQVKDVVNEGPLVEGSKAWEEAHEEDEGGTTSSITTPMYAAVDGSDEFQNVWER